MHNLYFNHKQTAIVLISVLLLFSCVQQQQSRRKRVKHPGPPPKYINLSYKFKEDSFIKDCIITDSLENLCRVELEKKIAIDIESAKYPQVVHPREQVYFNINKLSNVRCLLYTKSGEYIGCKLFNNLNTGHYKIGFSETKVHSGFYYSQIIKNNTIIQTIGIFIFHRKRK